MMKPIPSYCPHCDKKLESVCIRVRHTALEKEKALGYAEGLRRAVEVVKGWCGYDEATGPVKELETLIKESSHG